MSKMTEEVTRAIATKFLDGDEDFELIKEENYKNSILQLIKRRTGIQITDVLFIY